MGLKLKRLLHCPAPLCVLTCTAFIFGSLNLFKLIIISPRLWVSFESLLIVPSLSPALQLPDRGSGAGRQGHPAQGRLLLLLPCHQASVMLQALTACLQAAPPKGRTGRQVALELEVRGLHPLQKYFRKGVKFCLSPG